MRAMKSLLLLLALAVSTFAKDLPGPERFEKSIAAFEAADEAQMPSKGGTLFVGDSNIRRWESLPDRFKKDKVINRAFGGSMMSDVLHFAERIVLPYEPKQIYLGAGGNDLHSGRTPEEVLASFKAFVVLLRENLPQAKLSILSLPPSPARWAETATKKAANKLIADFIHADGDQIDFSDDFDLLLTSDGKPRPELYVKDGLHWSEAGYDIVTSAIKWQKEIVGIEKRYADKAAPKDPIVFVGSSSIRRWETLAADFPGKPVLNHGSGGSEVFDSLTYFGRLVLTFKPKQIVMYAGANDVNAGKSPERVLSDFKAFAARVFAELPGTKIAFISLAPNPKRWSQMAEIKATNESVRSFCESDARLTFVDVHPVMLGSNGEPKPDIFVEDQLHMNAKGYELWKGVIGPILE